MPAEARPGFATAWAFQLFGAESRAIMPAHFVGEGLGFETSEEYKNFKAMLERLKKGMK